MLMKVSMQPLRVLIVEQYHDVRSTFVAIFAAMGYVVESAKTGSEALALVPLFRPDAVFTSIFVRDQSGFELCAKLRQMPETAQALIVAVTGYASFDADDLWRKAGFDHYLLKPTSVETLLGTMKHLDGYRGNSLEEFALPVTLD